MTVACGPSFGACVSRITKVDAVGNVVTGDNMYVTDAPISFQVSPNKETGNNFSARNGCGCSIARFKTADIFNWFDITATFAKAEPAMEAIMLGAATIEDGSDVVGLAYPGALACDDDEPAAALEFWTKHIVGSAQDVEFPWIHFVFPYVVWSPGDTTYEEAFAQLPLVGFTRTNEQWGDGPYGDGPPDSQEIAEGGWWKTDVPPPSAECAAQHVTDSS